MCTDPSALNGTFSGLFGGQWHIEWTAGAIR